MGIQYHHRKYTITLYVTLMSTQHAVIKTAGLMFLFSDLELFGCNVFPNWFPKLCKETEEMWLGVLSAIDIT